MKVSDQNNVMVVPLNQTADHLKQIIELQSLLVSIEFDLENFINTVVLRVQELTSATGAVFGLIEGDEIVYKAVSGMAIPFLGHRMKMNNSLSGLCISQHEIMISEDTRLDSRVNSELCKKVGAASMVIVPLLRRGKVAGVLKVLSILPRAFNPEDMQILQLLAGLLGGALGQQLEIDRRKLVEEYLWHMAQNDSLTNLPNRALFNDRLLHAMARTARHKMPMALMYIDIDHFKSINDNYGHETGDAILKSFSGRLREVIRESDTLARLGGDEFTLIAENLHGKKDARIIADKILEAARIEFELPGRIMNITISGGIAINDGSEVRSSELLQQADKALYAAKKAGRNNFKFAA